MIEKVLRYYDQLVADLAACQQLGLPEGELIEAAYKLTMDYWTRVKQWLKDYEFPDPASEIRFFKEVKPPFTSQIEFYTHCYQALLFLPRGNNQSKIQYWQRELARIDGFYALHADFIEYYRGGAFDLDSHYFIRANNDGGNLDQAKSYDIDVEVATSHDWMVTALLGFEQYGLFINWKLEELE